MSTVLFLFTLFTLFNPLLLFASLVEYQILTQTGCRYFAGTSARVFLSLTGKDGKVLSTFLTPRKKHFPRCSVDVFTLESNIQLKDVCQITIGHGK